MKDTRVYSIIEMTIFFIALILHVVGFYLLYLTRKTAIDRKQRMFLMNLSLSEIIFLIGTITRRTLIFYEVPTCTKIFYYHECLINTGVFSWYNFVMALIAFDRFLEVWLNLRYHIIWTVKKATIAMIFVFVMPSIFVVVIFTFVDTYDHIRYLNSTYFWLSSEIIFIIVAIITYSYLYGKIVEKKHYTRRLILHLKKINPEINNGSWKRKDRNNAGTPKMPKNGFFVPTLLILSFITCWFVPDLIIFVHGRLRLTISKQGYFIMGILYCFAVLSDAIIYIFFSKHVRRILFKKISAVTSF